MLPKTYHVIFYSEEGRVVDEKRYEALSKEQAERIAATLLSEIDHAESFTVKDSH
jgi:hypothetical protein